MSAVERANLWKCGLSVKLIIEETLKKRSGIYKGCHGGKISLHWLFFFAYIM